MEAVALAIEGLAVAEWLRMSRWGYAAASALHVFGIALLVGAIVPLDLRLLGLWSSLEVQVLYRVLAPIAATGLALAVISGAALFAVRASEYITMELFGAKVVLVGLGATHALALHCGIAMPPASRTRQGLAGGVSLATWPAALVCGRLLAFV